VAFPYWAIEKLYQNVAVFWSQKNVRQLSVKGFAPLLFDLVLAARREQTKRSFSVTIQIVLRSPPFAFLFAPSV
jgi:hypothetical protein